MCILNTQGKTVVTYEFELEAIKKLIAQDMNVPEKELTVDYVLTDVADDRFSTRPDYRVSRIKVTHKPE